ncbi:uncharacterized protein B0I36DRAFT_412355, partial [Microdochium trichocladiopsis]
MALLLWQDPAYQHSAMCGSFRSSKHPAQHGQLRRPIGHGEDGSFPLPLHPTTTRNQTINDPALGAQVTTCVIHAPSRRSTLHFDWRSRESIDTAEALVLQSKLYINMGKPRKAWLCLRRAANTALLLGLHRADDRGRSQREESLWAQIWQDERFLSLSLGLPSAISNQHPSMSSSKCSFDEIHGPLRHRLCLLIGEIIERNQVSTPDYSTTVKIDQELEQYKTLMLDDFWSQPPCPDQPLVDIYHGQIAKISYLLCVTMLHIPFTLKAPTDWRYEHGCHSIQNASREAITSYLRLRGVTHAERIICEVLDFQVFCAGMILMFDLLSHPHRSAEQSKDDDITLVETLAESLERTATLMDG